MRCMTQCQARITRHDCSNDALEATIQKLKQSDPELKNTLIVITADHDHTLVLNGYAKRTGKYVEGKETSVLGLVKTMIKRALLKIFMVNLIRLSVLVRAKTPHSKPYG